MNKRPKNAPVKKAAAMTQEEMCVLAYLINRRILFRATEDIGHVLADMIGHVYEGRVKVVHPRKRRIKVEFIYHWTRGTTKTLWMDFENIVATWDRNMGRRQKIGRYTGPWYDRRSRVQKKLDKEHPDL